MNESWAAYKELIFRHWQNAQQFCWQYMEDLPMKKVKGIRMINKKRGTKYRVEKTIGGFSFDKTFSRIEDAENYIKLLESFRTSHSGTNGVCERIKFGKASLKYLEFIGKYTSASNQRRQMSCAQHFSKLFDINYEDVTNDMIAEIFENSSNLKTKEPLSRNSLKNLKIYINGVMDQATELGFPRKGRKELIARINRAIVKAPPPAPKQYYRKDAVKKLIDIDQTVRDVPSWAIVATIFYVTSGKRSGEVIGATWDRMDLDNKQFYLCQMVSEGHFCNHLKKGAEPQMLNLDDKLVKLLKKLKELNDALGDKKSDWVFPAIGKFQPFDESDNCPYQGKPISENSMSRYVKLIEEKVGLEPIKLHGLRITNGTLEYIMRHGTPMAMDYVKKKLNHKSTAITEGYIQLALQDIEAANGNKQMNLSAFCSQDEEDTIVKVDDFIAQEEELDRLLRIEEKKRRLKELRKQIEV